MANSGRTLAQGHLLLGAILLAGCESLAPAGAVAPSAPPAEVVQAAAPPAPGAPAVLRQAAWQTPAEPQPSEPAPKPEELPFPQAPELSVDLLVEQVLARNPSLAQMVAAWQAASARYPQVTSLDDPTFSATIGPETIHPDDPDVEFASR